MFPGIKRGEFGTNRFVGQTKWKEQLFFLSSDIEEWHFLTEMLISFWFLHLYDSIHHISLNSTSKAALTLR